MRTAQFSVRVSHARTGEIMINTKDTLLPYETSKELSASMRRNHQAFSETFPDCHVNFSWKEEGEFENFIYGMPYNQRQDEIALEEGHMTFDEYEERWY